MKKKRPKVIIPYGIVNGTLVDLHDILIYPITQCGNEMAFKGTDGGVHVFDWHGSNTSILFPDTIFRELCKEAKKDEIAIDTIYRVLSLPDKFIEYLKSVIKN